MKSETVNPWPIIRWSVVTLLFVATVALFSAKIATLEAKLANSHKVFKDIMASNRKLEHQRAEAVAGRNAAEDRLREIERNETVRIFAKLADLKKRHAELKLREPGAENLAAHANHFEHLAQLQKEIQETQAEINRVSESASTVR